MNRFYKQLIFIILSVVIITTGILVAVAVNNRGAAPVAWWRFDEGYGTTAYDASGNTNNGTLSGNTAWKNEPFCKTGKCLYFDGTGDYVTVSDHSTLRPTDGVTLETWVRPNQFDSSASLMQKDLQYSLDIAQGVPNFKAYANSLWHSAIGSARAWLFREPFDNQLTGDASVSFTEAFGYRALGPSALTSEKGILITDADGTGSGTGDNLQYSRGSQVTPDGTNAVYENFDPHQGTLEFWVRPNWAQDANSNYVIFGAAGDGQGWSNVQYYEIRISGNNINFILPYNGANTPVATISSSGLTAGTWYHIVAVWSRYKIDGTNYAKIYLNESSTAVTTVQHNPASGWFSPSVFTVGHRYKPYEVVHDAYFNGTIAGRILNRPLTSTEVTALYAEGAGHTDTFTVTPDTVWLGTYTDSTTTAAYWHTGKSVSAISGGVNEDTLTTASGADNSFSDGDRVVVYDGTGYKVEGCVDGSPGSTSFDVDDCNGGDPGATENVGVFATLNGSTQYFSVGGSNFSTLTSTFTIQFWAKMDANTNYLVSKGSSGYSDRRCFAFSGAYFTLADSSDTIHSGYPSWALGDNKWHHHVVTYDSGTLTFYRDAVQKNQFTELGTSTRHHDSSGFFVGTDWAVSAFLDGSIRDMAVFDDVRTPAEILDAATNPYKDYSGDADNVSQWLFADAASTTTIDDSNTTNNNDLSLVGGDTTNYGTHSRTQAAFVSKNLIVDPGMENGGIGSIAVRGGSPTIEKDTSTVKYDTQSLKITASAQSDDTWLHPDITVASGEDYLLRVHSIKDDNDSYYIRLWDTTNTSQISSVSYSSSAWQTFETAIEIPATCTTIRTECRASAGSGYPGTYNIDQIQLLPNLVDNGGLEGTAAGNALPAGWADYGTPDAAETQTTTTAPHSGSASIYVDTSADAEGVDQTAGTVVANQWYTVAFWAKVADGTLQYAGSNGSSDIDVTAAANGNTWTKYSQTFKASASIGQLIRFRSNSTGATYYLDDVSLVLLDTVAPTTVTPSTQANSFGTGKWSDTNGAFLVDGGDTLTYPTSGNISASTGTIAMWVKPNGWDGDDSVNHYFGGLWYDGDNSLWLYKDSSDNLGAFIIGAGTDKTVSYAVNSSNFGANTWHHVAMTYGAGESITLYLDGSSVGTPASGVVALSSLPTNLYLGSNRVGASDLVQADAYFDDVRIYDTVLTPTEIANLYNDTKLTTISANNWAHLTGVYSKSDANIKIYVNGVLKNTRSLAASYDLGTSTNSLMLGESFAGFLDEPRVYGYARSAKQVAADYIAASTLRGASGRSVTVGESADPSEGLIAHWDFDETALNACGTAQDACDATGNGNHLAALGNAAPTSTAKYGYAATFDGAGDYYCSDPDDDGVCEDDDDLELSNFTIQAWAKFSATGDRDGIVAKWTDSNQAYLLLKENTDKIILFVSSDGSGSSSVGSGGSTVSAATWYHVAGTYDGEKIKVYVNGVLEDSADYSSGIYQSGGAYVSAGHWNVSVCGDACAHDGQIDDVKIYNKARSASQIRRDYETGPPPVAHWKMDEKVSGDSQTLYDTSGSNDGTTVDGANNTGMDCTVSGKYGGACEFDGSDDYVDCGTAASLEISSGTYEAWFLVNSLAEQLIIGKDGGGYNNDGYIRISVSTNKLYFETDDNVTTITSIPSDSPVVTGRWYHVVATWGSAGMKMYVNGILQDSVSAVTNPIISSGNSFKIGQTQGGKYLNGKIDDVRIYNYARTQKQIMEDMNAGHPAVGSPLGSYVGYWKFDEGYGQTVYDQSVQSNDGTLASTTAVAGADPTWTTAGKFGRALSFDGSDDYVDCGTNSSLNITGAFTVSVWAKADSWPTVHSTIFSRFSGDSGYELRRDSSVMKIITADGSTWAGAGGVDADTPLGEWLHIVGTYDSTNLQLYVNGVKKGSPVASNAPGTVSASAIIGQRSGLTHPWDGIIDEVKIYPFALTPEEIKLEYNRGASLLLGAASTASDGTTPSNAASREYCVPGSTTSCNPPVAHWKMDEKGGQYAYDIAGTNDGTLGTTTAAESEDPTWQSAAQCHSGACLSFDGSDDYVIKSPSSADICGFSNGTIGAWVYLRSFSTTGACNEHNGSANCAEILFNYDWGYFFGVNDDGAIMLDLGDGSSWQTVDNTPASQVTLNTWHHIAVSAYGGTTIDYYLDGVKVASNTVSHTTFHCANNETTIGGRGVSTYQWDGLIDDVRIYDYARTPAQIAWEYNRGKPIAHWSMDSIGYAANSSSTIYDASGNNNNGIFNNEIMNNGTLGTSTGAVASNPTWTPARNCKYGPCLSFDGTDDYVNIDGVISDVTSDTQGTWALWVKPDSLAAVAESIAFGVTSGNKQLRILHNTNGKITVISHDDAYKWLFDTDNVVSTVNTWMHIALVHNGTEPSLFINGVQESITFSEDDDKTYWFSDYSGALTTARIGDFRLGASEQEFFNGLIDEVRIYDTALSATQVEALYLNNDRSAGASLEANLVGEWRFDEGGGDYAADTHYQRYGLRNYAMEFDGTDDYVDCGTDSTLDITGGLTVGAWIKQTSRDDWRTILSKGQSPVFNTHNYILSIESTGSIRLKGTFGALDSGSGFLELNTWHYVVGVADGTNLKIYVDGKQIALGSQSSLPTATPDKKCLIGAYSRSDSNMFHGLIDEVKIFNYALTPTQIRTEYNDGAARFGPSSGSP